MSGVFSKILFLGILQLCLTSIQLIGRDSEELKKLEDLTIKYKQVNTEKYQEAIHNLLDKAEDEHNGYYKCIAYGELGFFYLIESQYDSAIQVLQNTLHIAEQLEDNYLILRTTMYQGLVSLEMLDFFSALEYFKKHALIAQEIMSDETYLNSTNYYYFTPYEGYQMMGEVYRRCGDYEKAEEYFLKSTPEAKYDTLMQGNGWWNQNFGQLLYLKKDYEAAIAHFNSAMKTWKHLDMVRGMGYTKNSLGALYLEIEDKRAIDEYKEALIYNKEMNNYEQIVTSEMGIAKYYLKFNGDMDKVAELYNNAIEISIENNLEDLVIPAMNFFTENPKYIHELSIPYQKLLMINLTATESALKKSTQASIKVVEAVEKIRNAEEKQKLSQQKSIWFKRINLLLSSIVLITLIFVISIKIKNKKITSYSNEIIEQYDLIKEQTLVLNEVNTKLNNNNISLRNDFNLQGLKLTHFEKIFENIESINSTESNKKIKSIIRMKLKEDYWDELKHARSFQDKEFVSNLSNMFPKLTNNNLSLCCMLRMRLPIKEIAQITYKSPDAIKVARSRLRKKLNLSDNVNIEHFLNKL